MKVEYYKARDGWRWRLKAANNRIVADSGEAYTRLHDVKRAWRTLFGSLLLRWDEVVIK